MDYPLGHKMEMMDGEDGEGHESFPTLRVSEEGENYPEFPDSGEFTATIRARVATKGSRPGERFCELDILSISMDGEKGEKPKSPLRDTMRKIQGKKGEEKSVAYPVGDE